jgi:hypothetical protein
MRLHPFDSNRRKQRHNPRRPQLHLEVLEERLLLAAGIGTIQQLNVFETWDAGIIRSTDVAGITYHAPSGHLYLADSEINELSGIFNGDNMFEVSLAGDVVYREIESGNGEPTGITYSEYDGFFYVTNDVTRKVYRYDFNLDDVLKSVSTLDATSSADDPEGIASNPLTGDLYVADGSGGGRQVLVYNANLQYQYRFSVAADMQDAEGIAYDPLTNNVFLVSSRDQAVFEYSLTGELITVYDISGLSPAQIAAQGLTFAPTSDPNDPPNAVALYIADGMEDNHADGRIYEVLINRPGASDPGTGDPIPYTVGLYNPVNTSFYLKDTNSAGPADTAFRYGPLGVSWKPVVNDWDGDGSDTIGLYNPVSGTFFLKNSNAPGFADTTFSFGPVAANMMPVAGDWDSDGVATVGLYNPDDQTFHLTNTNAAGSPAIVFSFLSGVAGSNWMPVTGDWDGDGDVTVGLYDPQGGRLHLTNSNAAGAADLVYRYGPTNSNWRPVGGDWDADGVFTIGLFDPVAGQFYLRNSHSAGWADVAFRYGPKNSGWAPLAGRWNGTSAAAAAASSNSTQTNAGVLSAIAPTPASPPADAYGLLSTASTKSEPGSTGPSPTADQSPAGSTAISGSSETSSSALSPPASDPVSTTSEIASTALEELIQEGLFSGIDVELI